MIACIGHGRIETGCENSHNLGKVGVIAPKSHSSGSEACRCFKLKKPARATTCMRCNTDKFMHWLGREEGFHAWRFYLQVANHMSHGLVGQGRTVGRRSPLASVGSRKFVPGQMKRHKKCHSCRRGSLQFFSKMTKIILFRWNALFIIRQVL